MLTSGLHCLCHHERLRGLLLKVRLEGLGDYELVEGIPRPAEGVVSREARA